MIRDFLFDLLLHFVVNGVGDMLVQVIYEIYKHMFDHMVKDIEDDEIIFGFIFDIFDDECEDNFKDFKDFKDEFGCTEDEDCDSEIYDSEISDMVVFEYISYIYIFFFIFG